MLNFFKNKKVTTEDNDISIISVTSLLIHAAKIDENYAENEKNIIKKTLIKLGAGSDEIESIFEKAELAEQNSNQILEFTKEAKNLEQEKKIILIEALWSIIYSDEQADIYETNFMRRVTGLIYLDNKLVGDIKLKVKNQKR